MLKINNNTETGCGCKDCKGLFIDAETLEVTRCDDCGVYQSDLEAAEAIRKALNIH